VAVITRLHRSCEKSKTQKKLIARNMLRNVSVLLKVEPWELGRNCLARKHINLLENLIEAKGRVKEIRTVN